MRPVASEIVARNERFGFAHSFSTGGTLLNVSDDVAQIAVAEIVEIRRRHDKHRLTTWARAVSDRPHPIGVVIRRADSALPLVRFGAGTVPELITKNVVPPRFSP